MLLSGLLSLTLSSSIPLWTATDGSLGLLTGAVLSEHGYPVGRCLSLEQAIAESADAYYQALLDSTHGWHVSTADPWPWLGYFTSVIAGAYAVFADRGSGPDPWDKAAARPRAHPAPCTRHVPPRRRQDGSARCQ